MSVTINYKNDTLATFRRATKTLTTKGKFLEDDISITDDTTNGSVYQDDDGYVVINDEAGSGLSLLPLNVTENGTYQTNNEDTGYSPVTVNVHTDPTLQSKSVNPTESSLTVKPDTNYDGLSLVTVGAISNTYVGSSVPRMAATNLTVSGSTITAPAGYYASAVSKNVAGGTATTPGTSVTTNPTITLSNTTGVITASYNSTTSITPTVTAGYISAGTAGTVRYSGTATYSLSTLAAKTVTPTETILTVVSSRYFTTGDVKVAGISSDYVGTNVTRISAADMTHSGGTVTAPSGYYASALTHAVGNGTATTPATTLTFAPAISVDAATGKITATVSGSSNITPTVTAGYINAGTAGKITVSGSNTLTMSTKAAATITPTETAQTVVSSGYYTLGDVKVAAISSTYVGTGVTTRSSANLTVNGATVTAPAGYYSAAAAATVATATLASPTVAISNTTGLITATLAENTGYITGGTTTGTLLLTSIAGKTITPTEAQLTAVARYRWTKGSVYVAGISSTYVGTGVPTGSAANLTADGSTVTVPSGYYSSLVTKNVGAGTATTPGTTLTFAPAISINAATGKITATVSGSSKITPTVTAGYIAAGTSGTISVTGTSSYTLSTKAAATITPTTASLLAVSSGYYTTGSVYVGAIPSAYIIPTGTLSISKRGTYDVKNYSSVIADISTDRFVARITENPSQDLWVRYDNTTYKESGAFFDYLPGETLTVVAQGRINGGQVYVDGQKVADSGQNSTVQYEYTLPNKNIEIRFVYSNIGYVYITTLSASGENDLINQFITRTISGVYVNSEVTEIGTNAFYSCTKLTSVSFPNVSRIRADAFYNCTSITNVSFPAVTMIDTYAFFQCTALKSVYFSQLTSIPQYAFFNCINLSTVSFPNVTSIGTSAFANCNLSSVSFATAFPQLTQINDRAFCSTKIQLLYHPGILSLRYSCFQSCKQLSKVNLPAVTVVEGSAFCYCTSLKCVSLPAVTSIGAYAFYNCSILESIYLLGSSVPSVGASPIGGTAIHTSAFAGHFGSIYVRQSLLASFQAVSNLSVYSSRFVGLTDAQIAALG